MAPAERRELSERVCRALGIYRIPPTPGCLEREWFWPDGEPLENWYGEDPPDLAEPEVVKEVLEKWPGGCEFVPQGSSNVRTWMCVARGAKRGWTGYGPDHWVALAEAFLAAKEGEKDDA